MRQIERRIEALERRQAAGTVPGYAVIATLAELATVPPGVAKVYLGFLGPDEWDTSEVSGDN